MDKQDKGEGPRRWVRVNLVSKSICGSIVGDGYDNDTPDEVIAWLSNLMGSVPPELRHSARVEIESVGGYEGEHHAEISVHYDRPETDEEMRHRLAHESRERRRIDEFERRQYEALKKKFG